MTTVNFFFFFPVLEVGLRALCLPVLARACALLLEPCPQQFAILAYTFKK
jgi:hypothetical protein